MKQNSLASLLVIALAALGLASIYFWLHTPLTDLPIRIAGRDNRPPVIEGDAPEIKGTLVKMTGTPGQTPGAWPWFRGQDLKGIYNNPSITLAQEWPETGPTVLWSIPVGEGHAGPAIRDGSVYLIDYDRENSHDLIRCLSLETGQDIWQYSYPVKVKRNHGMSRTVPAVTDQLVITLGPKCHVTCLDRITGDKHWNIDLVQEYGTKVPLWYAGQCPLIDQDKLILAPAGKEILMMAIDPLEFDDGPIWTCPNTPEWDMTHSSIMPVDFDGKHIYIYCASGGVVGVDAADGKLLFEFPDWKINIANVATPLIIGDGRIFFSGGYNAGSMMAELVKDGDNYKLIELFRLPAETFGAAQHTPILWENHILGIRPDEQFVCLDLDGNVTWTSGSDQKFGIGPYMIANSLIYAMDDHGLMRLFPASTTGYNLLAEANVLEGPDSWGPFAIAGTKLIVRDLNTMKCLDIGAQ